MQKIFKSRNEMLHDLPKNIKIAEIGVFKGDFSKIIYEILTPTELYLIDLFSGYMGSGDKDGKNMQFVILEEYYNHLTKYFNNPNVKLMKGKSVDMMSKLEDNFLDMVYIDASHEYKDVCQDLEISYKKVKNGGFICGHDYDNTRFPGVYNAVNEFCEKNKLMVDGITQDGLPSYMIILKK